MPKNKYYQLKKKKSEDTSDDEDFLTAESTSEHGELDIPSSPASTSSYHTAEEDLPSDAPPSKLKQLGNKLKTTLSSINQSTAYKPLPKEESDDDKPKSQKKPKQSADTIPEEDDENIEESTKLLKIPKKSINNLASSSLSDKLKNLLPKSKYAAEPDIQDSPLHTKIPDSLDSIKTKEKEGESQLAKWDEEHIKCYILDKTPKSSWLPSISNKNQLLLSEQHKLFIDFLERAAAQYPDPKALATVEANNFSPADLKALITKLNKKTPRILVRLKLPEALDQCSYLIKTNTNQTETKQMTQQEYDKAKELITKYNSKIDAEIKQKKSNKPTK